MEEHTEIEKMRWREIRIWIHEFEKPPEWCRWTSRVPLPKGRRKAVTIKVVIIFIIVMIIIMTMIISDNNAGQLHYCLFS